MTYEINPRIDELEKRVDWIENYLGRHGAPVAPQTIAIPPVLTGTADKEAVKEVAKEWRCIRCGSPIPENSGVLCSTCQAAQSRPIQPPPVPRVTFTGNGGRSTQTEKPDAEFILGARILPRVGAVLVLLGLAFFAGWAYTNGWITPWLAFLGEVGASVAFLAIGFGLGRTKEQFGEVLKAVGSAGLFTSLAAGHLYHHVFNAEAMLGGCLLLSTANMAYSVAAKSRTFWGLGLAGGLITAFLPLTQNNILVSEQLVTLVVSTALVTAGMQRWLKAIVGAWTIFLFPQLAFINSHLPWVVRVAHLEGVSLIAILAYAFAYFENNTFDARAWAPRIMGIGAGLLGFYVQDGPLGSLHVAVLGASVAATALYASKKPALQSSLYFTAGGLVLVLAPFGLPTWYAPAAMIALAACLLAAEAKIKRSELCWLAAYEVVSASSVALVRFDQLTRDAHIALNAAMLVLLIPMAIAFRRHLEDDSPVFGGHCLAGLFFASEIGAMLDNHTPSFGMPVTIAWTLYGLALLLLGLWGKIRDMRVAGILILLLTLVKVVFYDMSSVDLIAKVAVFTGLGLAMLVGGYLVIRLRGEEPGEK